MQQSNAMLGERLEASQRDFLDLKAQLVAVQNEALRDDSDRNDSAYLRELQRAWIGDRKLNKQQFDTVSPLKQVQRIRAPVLVVHGERDARVPIEHSKKLVAALKREGKTYEWIELEGEGHGIVQAKNIKRFHEALIDFLDRHIGNEEPAGAAQDAAPTK